MSAGTSATRNITGRRRAVHVTQISRDGDLLSLPFDSEPVQRQLSYARELSSRAPGSVVTIVVFTTDARGSGWQRDNVRVVPVAATAVAALAMPVILRRLHRAMPIDVITTQVPYDEAWLALAFGRWNRIPVIAQIHSDLFADVPAASRRVRLQCAAHRWLTRKMLGRFSAVRTVSSGHRTAVARHARRVPLATIPVPVAMVASRDFAVRRPLAKEPLVLFVGRLAPEKDLTTWLKVAHLIAQCQPGTRFLIAGDGPERPRLEAAVARLGLVDVVEFAGRVAYSELRTLYARASAVLLTSPSEGFARVLVEAASQGTPAVSTSSAGPRDIVINGVTGFLHDAGDIAGLAHSVCRLVAEPTRAAMMGAQARALVAVKFDPRRLSAAWVDLWIDTARQAAPSS